MKSQPTRNQQRPSLLTRCRQGHVRHCLTDAQMPLATEMLAWFLLDAAARDHRLNSAVCHPGESPLITI